MKSEKIQKGQMYFAKVSGRVVVVKVEEIQKIEMHKYCGFLVNKIVGKNKIVYHCTNTKTNRKVLIKSSAKFRAKVLEHMPSPKAHHTADSQTLCLRGPKRFWASREDRFLLTWGL